MSKAKYFITLDLLCEPPLLLAGLPDSGMASGR